jgi:hypothetical protein
VKFTAIFHTSESSKYDGTCTYARLVDIIDENGKLVPADDDDPRSSLWEECDEETRLYTDQPGTYGMPDETVEVFGQLLTLEDFKTAEYLPDDTYYTGAEVFRLEFEAELGPDGHFVVVPPFKLLGWLNDMSNVTLSDVNELLAKVKGPGKCHRLVEDSRFQPHGVALVVWEGVNTIDSDRLADAVAAQLCN